MLGASGGVQKSRSSHPFGRFIARYDAKRDVMLTQEMTPDKASRESPQPLLVTDLADAELAQSVSEEHFPANKRKLRDVFGDPVGTHQKSSA